MGKVSYVNRVKDPQPTPRRYEKKRGAAPNWVPDPIHVERGFVRQHKARLWICAVVFLLTSFLLWDALMGLPTLLIEEYQAINGGGLYLTPTLIATFMTGVIWFFSAFLPWKWKRDYDTIRDIMDDEPAEVALMPGFDVQEQEEVIFDEDTLHSAQEVPHALKHDMHA